MRCATLNGAQAVKVNAGAIEVGRLADLIALDCRYHDDDGSSGGVHAATDADDNNHVKNLRLRRAVVSLRSLSLTRQRMSLSLAAETPSHM